MRWFTSPWVTAAVSLLGVGGAFAAIQYFVLDQSAGRAVLSGAIVGSLLAFMDVVVWPRFIAAVTGGGATSRRRHGAEVETGDSFGEDIGEDAPTRPAD